MVKKKRVWLILGIILLLVIGIFLLANSEKESFSLKPDYPIKLTITSGSQGTNTVKIINKENIGRSYKLNITGLDSIASLSEDNFIIEPKQSKEVILTFKGNENFTGVYLGKLIVENPALKKEIPILILFEKTNNQFAIIQKPILKYSSVYPGGILGLDIKIFDLQPAYIKEITIKYTIKNFDGELIFYSDEKAIIDREYGFSKLFDINNNYAYGDYVLLSFIDYKGVELISPYLFDVAKKPRTIIFSNSNLFMAITLIFVVVIVFLFFYFVRTRDALLVQLEKQQNEELKRNIELITKSQNVLKELKFVEGREKKVNGLEIAKKRVYEKIKKKQKKQQQEFKKLKKQGIKKSDLENKFTQWKKEGYDFGDTENEIRNISKGAMNKQLEEWKKRGYDLRGLKK